MTDATVSLGPATVNFTDMVANDSWTVGLTLSVNGTAMDLTGQTITAKMKIGSTSYPITVTVTNAAAGQLTLSMTTSPTIPTSPAVWALRVGARTMLEGTVTGRADVLA